MENEYDFGDVLKELISCRGLSIREFASKIGVSEDTVDNYISGCRPSKKLVSKMARVLNVSPEFLMAGDEETLEDDNSTFRAIKAILNNNMDKLTDEQRFKLITKMSKS